LFTRAHDLRIQQLYRETEMSKKQNQTFAAGFPVVS
jgi:hypothetical protein